MAAKQSNFARAFKYLGIAALCWVVVRAARPKWYDDLMLRAFASDQTANPGQSEAERQKFEQAADIAARAVMPIGWVLKLAEVATGTTLEQAVQQVQQKVLAMGPPKDTQPQTLAAYKQQALAAGGPL